jgi:hypothetical protein
MYYIPVAATFGGKSDKREHDFGISPGAMSRREV